MARLGQHDNMVSWNRGPCFDSSALEVEEDRGWLQGPGGRVRLSANRTAVAGANGLSRAEYEGDR